MTKALSIAALVLAALALWVGYGSNQKFGQLPNYQSTLTNQASLRVTKTQGTFILGPILAATSTATTSVSLPKGLNWGLAVGDQCGVQLSSMSSTLGFSGDGYITSIGNTNATATVAYFNGANANVTIVTGTLTLVCNHN